VPVVVHHAVVEPVVAVDDRRRALLGDVAQEQLVDLVHVGHLAQLRLLELPVPALELALDVALLAAEVAEADRVGVDGVDLGHDVDERLAGRAPLRGVRAASAVAASRRMCPSTKRMT
jgi:hypothetical protein